MPTYDHIQYEVENGAATLTLDRTEKLNAMNEALIGEFETSLNRAEDDDDVRALVITGAGRAFCSGFDLSEAGGRTDRVPSVEDWLARLKRATSHLDAIYELDIPVIAAVNGYAYAGGLELAVICDIAVASEDAEFSLQGVRMGGYPPVPMLPYVVSSMKHVREIMYTGGTIDADEAARIGLVNRTVPPDDLMTETWDVVDGIKKVPGTAVTITKHTLNGVVESQGYRPSRKMSEFIDILAHSTEGGQKFMEIRNEEGVDAAMKWMKEADKD